MSLAIQIYVSCQIVPYSYQLVECTLFSELGFFVSWPVIMPVYVRKNLLSITPESLGNRSSDEEDYIRDPEQMYDVLPQPFRLVNKIVNLIFDLSWEIISEREAARIAEKSRIKPPQYDCAIPLPVSVMALTKRSSYACRSHSNAQWSTTLKTIQTSCTRKFFTQNEVPPSKKSFSSGLLAEERRRPLNILSFFQFCQCFSFS